jgi:plastocyanin
MAQVWSIMINGNVPAKFNPDVFGTNSGEPLKAQLGDLVSWNNQTSVTHRIAVTKAGGTTTFLPDEIKDSMSSTPGYVTQSSDVVSGTISYHCTLHLKDGNPTENGTITVVGS